MNERFLPSVTQVLKYYQDYSNVSLTVLEAAQERGIAVHAFCAMYARSLFVNEIPPELSGYFASFRAWFDQYVEKVHLVEQRLIDFDYGFTGMPDLIVTMVGENFQSLPDIKTPRAGSRVWILQNAAYCHLANKSGYYVKKGFSLRLDPDGKEARAGHFTTPLHQDFNIFLNALNVWRYLNA
jgi:hypothetical protein